MRAARRLSSFLMILGAVSAAGAAAQDAQRPNIVLIVADDLGYAEVGAFGQREIQTPNLDRLAREGLKLTQFYSGSPVCAPARCALMLGLHTGHCPVPRNGPYSIRPGDVTVAEVLQHAGYSTGAFGKWGLARNDWGARNDEVHSAYPTRQGFDRFFGYINQRHAHNFYPTFLISDADTVRLPNVVPNEGRYGEGDAPPSGEKVYSQDVILEEALEFIRANRGGPFFAYLPFTLPHINNEGRDAPDAGFEVPDISMYAGRPWHTAKKSYAGMITRLDRDVGRVVDLLRELGIDRRTLVLFTSDNGPTGIAAPSDGSTTIAGLYFDGNGPLRGTKGDVYEGGLRVPTIAYWPGVIAPGSESDFAGYFPDVLPTLAELAGVSAPTNIDGISLLPTILGRPGQASRNPMVWFYPPQDQRAVRDGRWKAVWYQGEPALYDLTADLGENDDVKARHPEIMDRLTGIAVQQITWPDATMSSWNPRLTEPAVVVSD